MKSRTIILLNVGVSLIVYAALLVFNLYREYNLFLIYAIFSSATFWGLVYNEIKYFDGIKLSLLLVVSYIIRLVIPSIDHSIEGVNTGSIYMGEYRDLSNSVFQTSILMNIFYMIVYYSLYKTNKNTKVENYILPYLKKYNFSKISFLLYSIGTLYTILTYQLPNTVIPFMVASILGNLTMMAMLLQLLNTVLLHTNSKHRIFAIMIFLEILRTMLFGFMKGPVMYAVSFYFIYSILRAKYTNTSLINFKNISIASLSLVFLLYIVYPYITIKRDMAQWDIAAGGVSRNSYSSIDILTKVLLGDYNKKKSDSNSSDRLDALNNNAFFINYIDNQGNYNKELLIENLQGLIPRVFNPNKHASRAGLMATSLFYYGNTSGYGSVNSNSYVGQAAGAYMVGGFFCVILFAIFNGVVISRFYQYLVLNINNLLSLVFLVQLLTSALTGFEEVHDGGITRCLLYIIYAIVIWGTSKIGVFKLTNQK